MRVSFPLALSAEHIDKAASGLTCLGLPTLYYRNQTENARKAHHDIESFETWHKGYDVNSIKEVHRNSMDGNVEAEISIKSS